MLTIAILNKETQIRSFLPAAHFFYIICTSLHTFLELLITIVACDRVVDRLSFAHNFYIFFPSQKLKPPDQPVSLKVISSHGSVSLALKTKKSGT